jgi:hypothetical protein
MIKKLFIALLLLTGSMSISAQNADLGINSISVNPPILGLGQSGLLTADVRNFGFDAIPAGCALVTISVPAAIVSIVGLNPGSNPVWTVFSSVLPASITLRNTGGALPPDFLPYNIILDLTGANLGGPLTINASAALNPFQAGCVASGNVDPTNDAATTSVTVSPVLSVKLSSFEGGASGCKASLSWVSKSEENSKEYQVQVSRDGTTFITIGTIPAAGNSNVEKPYQYADQTPGNGYNYYRLKMVDVDGKISYSGVVTIKAKCDDRSIRLFPNPVIQKNNLTVVITGYAGTLKGELIDGSGKVIRAYTMKNGSNTVLMESMAQANYILRVTDAATGVSESFKVVVIK